MKCPFCGCDDTIVKDSRNTDDNSAIRRRRECPDCGSRFTTFERVQLRELVVIKKNGEKTPFDADKLHRSVSIAVSKRPVSLEKVDKIVNSVQRKLEASGDAEVPTSVIGELVLEALSSVDTIACIRFASVYKDFREISDLEKFVAEIMPSAVIGKDKKGNE